MKTITCKECGKLEDEVRALQIAAGSLAEQIRQHWQGVLGEDGQQERIAPRHPIHQWSGVESVLKTLAQYSITRSR